MSAEDIRNIVERCYIGTPGYVIPNQPNALDGSNPASAGLGGTSGGPVPTPTPADVIQELVGRCYAGTPPLRPNPLDQQNPEIPVVPAVEPPPPTPAEVIQELVGRCYPGLPQLQPSAEIPEVDDNVIDIDFGFLDWISDYIPDMPWIDGGLIIKTPDPNDHSSVVYLGDGDDCAEVMKLRVRGQVESIGNYRWRNKLTGEILYCKDNNREQDLDWERCVRNSLDCFFRPYIGGRWTPPKQDGDTYYPNNWSANKDRVCVKNCFPPRVPIYETESGGKHRYSRVGSGDAAFYILRDAIYQGDKELTTGLYYYTNSSGDGFMTTNPGSPDSPGPGERSTMNAAGMQFSSLLGHVFTSGSDMISWMGDDEQANALYRYYNGNDHMYTIDPEFEQEFPQTYKKLNAYRIPRGEIQANLLVTTDTEKGSAGYDNALGYYLATENGPQVGYVVVPSAQSGSDINRVTITASQLNSYRGGSMGFFLIPDGGDQNSLSRGQQINFQTQGDGFRGSGISTAEGNYCLFSDHRWNPNDKDQTKWHGRNKQMWEDLMNGDDDYDDLKFWHKVQWQSNGYHLEGIQCYVYEDDAPPPVYRSLAPSGCDSRIVENSFKDVTIARTGCGGDTPSTISVDFLNDHECKRCVGSYSARLNDTQTVAIKGAGTYRIVSMGGITGGTLASCMKFRFRFKKNGSTIYTGTWTAERWPAIGKDIHTSDINLNVGDTFTFEFLELITGPQTGTVSPHIALYDLDKGVFDSSFAIQLSSVMADDDIMAFAGGSGWTNPIQGNIGAIQSFGMQFKPYNSGKYQAGSKATDSWHVNSEQKSVGRYTNVYSNSLPVSMHGALELNPEHLGGHSRTENNRFMPNISGGYIDTGYISEALSEYEQYEKPTHLYRKLTGCYNNLLENFLVTRFDGLNISGGSTIKDLAPTAFAKTYQPWYEVGIASRGDGYENTLQSEWTAGPAAVDYYAPTTFIHDYVLDGDALQGAGNISVAAKLRIGITFYPTRVPTGQASRTRYYWQAVIHVIQIIYPGQGYQEGMAFDLQWPPNRREDDENTSATPYYPDYQSNFKLPKKKLVAWYEDDKMARRLAKEAIYQESHNTNSPIWYFCSDRNRDRMKFRIIITQAS